MIVEVNGWPPPDYKYGWARALPVHLSLLRLFFFTPPPGPSIQAYKGSGNPGGARSYQGRDVSYHAITPQRPGTGRFFGGSGSGPSRGDFPFSFAENRRIGAI